MSRIIESFAALCEEATNFGATIGFEIMGCAMIDNIKDALTMVETANAENGGVIIDIRYYMLGNFLYRLLEFDLPRIALDKTHHKLCHINHWQPRKN